MTSPGEDSLQADVPETTAQLKRVAAAARDLDAAWKAAAADCNPTGKLGKGPIGRAFQPTIDAAAKAAEPIALIAPFYQKRSDEGQDSMKYYRIGENEVTAAFNRGK